MASPLLVSVVTNSGRFCKRAASWNVSWGQMLRITPRVVAFASGAPTNCLNRGINCDSVAIVTREGHKITLPKEKLTQGLALAVLLLLMGLAIAGPSGLLAWGENAQLLDERQARIAQLSEERDALKNRVDLLNPNHADADLVGEQLRQNFNVVHPDEVVLMLDPKAE